MPEDKKQFFDIRTLTDRFRNETKLGTDPEYWQSVCQLAIAQQLSVIAGLLRDLLEAVHRSEGKNK